MVYFQKLYYNFYNFLLGRFLMGRVSRAMTGRPWHKEYLKRGEDDNKRDKRRCQYYDAKNNYCTHLCVKCTSSTSCKYYLETDKKHHSSGKHPERKGHSNYEEYKKVTDAEGLATFPIGSLVRHKKYGEGKVICINNGSMTILFADTKMEYDLGDVLRNRLFERIKADRIFKIVGKYEGEYTIKCYEDKLSPDIFQTVDKGLSLRVWDTSNNKWICIHIFVDTSQKRIYMKKDRYMKYKREIFHTQTMKIVER